ncbi:hypothetical protein PIB30_060839 [Stylosanthes scabra]|uniref:Uncharacterized protein n=1 Tax=Stylosanthes scabra TaxID=79078 RepID=A0ABU6UJQ7_9FABA|nr:hypothetical protein [Stylosanthes scabra]
MNRTAEMMKNMNEAAVLGDDWRRVETLILTWFSALESRQRGDFNDLTAMEKQTELPLDIGETAEVETELPPRETAGVEMELPRKDWRNCQRSGDGTPTDRWRNCRRCGDGPPTKNGETAKDVEMELPRRDGRKCRKTSTTTPKSVKQQDRSRIRENEGQHRKEDAEKHWEGSH